MITSRALCQRGKTSSGKKRHSVEDGSMTTLRTSPLSKPEADDKVSAGTLRYMAIRNRQKAFDLVIKEFKKNGISQATLARRLGKAPEVISRLLARPRNWELDTFSELMFGISGVQPHFSVSYPLDNEVRGREGW